MKTASPNLGNKERKAIGIDPRYTLVFRVHFICARSGAEVKLRAQNIGRIKLYFGRPAGEKKKKRSRQFHFKHLPLIFSVDLFLNLSFLCVQATAFSSHCTKKIKFSIKDCFSKCDQIRWRLRILSHLLKNP